MHKDPKNRHLCHLCEKDKVVLLLDFKSQPVCNRFLHKKTTHERLYPLRLGQCSGCGMIQLMNPLSVQDIRPHFDWIRYSEPEEHLFDLVEMIRNLNNINSDSFICGLSNYDVPLIERLKEKGFCKSQMIDPESDFGISYDVWGLETLIDCLQGDMVKRIKILKNKPDIIIASFIVEHAWNLKIFLNNLKKMVSPSGYIVLQVPDFEASLISLDYNSIWEEHVLYFTKDAFNQCFFKNGFELILLKSYPEQNILVAVCQLANKKRDQIDFNADIKNQIILAKEYKNNFLLRKSDIQNRLNVFRKEKGKIAVLGAGHQACQFINLFDIGEMIDFVVDDFEMKQGLFMPGSHLEIKSSNALLTENIKLCLLAVSTDYHDKIVSNNKKFTDNGGRFGSIYQKDLGIV